MKADSKLDFQTAPLQVVLAFSDWKAVTRPARIAQHQMRNYVKLHIWISSRQFGNFHLEHGVFSDRFQLLGIQAGQKVQKEYL